MLILFDHSTPAPLRTYLKEHAVTEARDRGWDRLSNGDLLDAAEAAGFEVLVTADKNIRYQQNPPDAGLQSWSSAPRVGAPCYGTLRRW
jgi:hypothetical protein